MQVAIDAAELPGCFEHTGGAPAQCHFAVSPAFHVGGVVSADLDHRPRWSSAACVPGLGHAEAGHGERRSESFAQAPGGAGRTPDTYQPAGIERGTATSTSTTTGTTSRSMLLR